MDGDRLVRAEVWDSEEGSWTVVGVESISAHEDPAERVAYWTANADLIGPKARDVHAAEQRVTYVRL